MTVRCQPLGRCERRARSWTPMSRADRNRLRRGEQPRVELLKSTWWSYRYAIWERRLLRVVSMPGHGVVVDSTTADRVIATYNGQPIRLSDISATIEPITISVMSTRMS